MKASKIAGLASIFFFIQALYHLAVLSIMVAARLAVYLIENVAAFINNIRKHSR